MKLQAIVTFGYVYIYIYIYIYIYAVEQSNSLDTQHLQNYLVFIIAMVSRVGLTGISLLDSNPTSPLRLPHYLSFRSHCIKDGLINKVPLCI